jgi:hypothetical protein
VDLRPYIGFKATITAGGKTLVGWIKAAGTGETLDSELITNGGFDDDSWWWKEEASITISGGKAHFTNTQNSRQLYYPGSWTIGTLYKLTFEISGTTEGNIIVYNSGSAKAGFVDGSHTYYAAAKVANDYYSFQANGETTLDIDNASMKKVLTPSATGVTITSTQAGGTYNWASDDGIDPNAASFAISISA